MSENKVIKFDLDPKTLKVKELLNKDFLELEIKAISTANKTIQSLYRKYGNDVKDYIFSYNIKGNKDFKHEGMSDKITIRHIQYVHELQHILLAFGMDADLKITDERKEKRMSHKV